MTSGEILWMHLIAYGMSTLIMLWALAGPSGYVGALAIASWRRPAGEPVEPHLPLWLDQPRLVGYALRGIEWGWPYVAPLLRLGHRAYGLYCGVLYWCEERCGGAAFVARCVHWVSVECGWAVLELWREAEKRAPGMWITRGWHSVALALRLALRAFDGYRRVLYSAEERWGRAAAFARCTYRASIALRSELLELREGGAPTASHPPVVRERGAETADGTGPAAVPDAAPQGPRAHPESVETAPTAGPPAVVQERGAETGMHADPAEALEAALQAVQAHPDGGETTSASQVSGPTIEAAAPPPAGHDPGAAVAPAPRQPPAGRAAQAGDAAAAPHNEPEAALPEEPPVPDIVQRARAIVKRIRGKRTTMIHTLGELRIEARVSGRLMTVPTQTEPGRQKEGTISHASALLLAVLATKRKALGRKAVRGILWPGDANPDKTVVSRLTSYKRNLRDAYQACLQSHGCTARVAKGVADQLLISDRDFLGLDRDLVITDLEFLRLINAEARVASNAGDVQLALALWASLADVITAAPLAGLEVPLESPIEWDGEWIAEYRTRTQNKLALMLRKGAHTAHEHGRPVDRFAEAAQRLGIPWEDAGDPHHV